MTLFKPVVSALLTVTLVIVSNFVCWTPNVIALPSTEIKDSELVQENWTLKNKANQLQQSFSSFHLRKKASNLKSAITNINLLENADNLENTIIDLHIVEQTEKIKNVISDVDINFD